MRASTTLTDEQVVNINLYLRKHGLACWECDANHWFAMEISSIPDGETIESDEPIAIRVAVECGYCRSRRSLLMPLSACYPHLDF